MITAKNDSIRSETIKTSRTLCIFFVMYVHVYSGYPHPFPTFGNVDAWDIIYAFVVDVLGRSSVPLLTIISGYLFASGQKRPYKSLIYSKSRSLLVPLIFFNAILLVMLMTFGLLTGDRSKIPIDILGWVNAVSALTAPSINVPLAFLRDLFAVFLISPVIRYLLVRRPILVLVILFFISALVPSTLFLLRTQIIFFFALGMVLAGARFDRLPPAVVGLAAVGVLASFLYEVVNFSNRADLAKLPGQENLFRLAVAILVWAGAGVLVRRGGRLLVWLERYTFIAFCSHVIFFMALSLPGKMIFGDLSSDLYPIYFLIQPPLAFVFAIAICEVMHLTGVRRIWSLNAGRAVPPVMGSVAWRPRREVS